MPHQQEEKIYLNALNIALQSNFLKLSSLLKANSSFKKVFESAYPALEIKPDPFEEWKRLEERQIKFITQVDKEYPPLLKGIDYPPLGLYLKGEIPKDGNFISVVGTRKASSYGKLATEKIVKELISYNFIIVSGLAFGIDTISHRTALENDGITIAILGSGLDWIFPPSNKNLSEKILRQGALISEYPLGTPPLKHHFLWRNRIISGLSPATLVIEAPEKSGALITGYFAVEQNRDVFAVPGSIFNQNSRGTNNLIKQGAKLITKVEDILEEFNINPEKEKRGNINFSNELEKTIYQLLDWETPLSIDKIIEKVNLKTNEVLVCLTSLEIKELIKNLGGGNYIKQT